MRRKDREVKDFETIEEIIAECEVIRIGLSDGDYPYIVPLNFGYTIEGGQIYFYVHGAMAGKKYGLMKEKGVCSFEMDCAHKLELLPAAKNVTMRYKSLMGKAAIECLEGDEKKRGIDILMDRDERTCGFAYNEAAIPKTFVAKLTVTEYTGKINPPGEHSEG